jgi:GTP diphosphokinase / guanosine-3',5'-bis(diphosphate) 3'-diphosphatase
VILIKLADRLHNMRTLEHLPPERQKRIARETLDIYAPIALRLGMARIRGELEDLAFASLERVSYEILAVEVDRKKAESEEFIRGVIDRLKAVLAEQGIEARLENRIKRLYSIHQKMKRQKIGLNQVYDFVAIRILVDTVRDCYTVLGVVNNLWSPVPGRIKDFIAMPRDNMYQSLHTTVIGDGGLPFEVQIRDSRNASHFRGGNRGPLEVQGREAGRRKGGSSFSLAEAPSRMAAGGARSPPVSE